MLEPIAQVHQTLLAMEARRSTMAQPLVLPTRLAVAVSRLETMTQLSWIFFQFCQDPFSSIPQVIA